ncbi:MAG: PSD1 and planctomycete cytochrome C domain-containing protein [Acidobacteria bacterium]|nr:PSD1 and planctomycete cytochrome C domain-containing protein [Acidobacteriota bacterium]
MKSREALLKGGNSGPAMVPGNAESSLLVQAIRRTHDRLKMPPQEPLPKADVETLITWIQHGAVWPETPPAAAPHGQFLITPEQRDFWAFRPPRKPPLPEVKDTAWVRSLIDRFVLAKLEEKGLKPAPRADKRSLIRRAYLDLIGLPPTPEEVAAFAKDRSPDAFAKLVDRLLASPHYGERWARHWLDVARYTDEAPRRREAASRRKEEKSQSFRYRDWVIKAFNDDMPYDVFAMAQIAGDQLKGVNRQDAVGGLGFYALTPSEQDDRIDVTGSAFLAMSIACARCHDHKFDPMPTEDYYSLLGVFNSTQLDEHPLALEEVVEQYKSLRKAADDEQAALDRFLETQRVQLIDALAAQSASYLKASGQVLGPAKRDAKELAAAASLDPETLERWVKYLRDQKWEHTYLNGWVKLLQQPSPSEAEMDRLARDFQEDLIAILREKKEIDKENGLRLGRIAPDTPGNKIGLVALERNKFYLWKDMAAHERFQSGTNTYDAGILYYAGDQIERFLDGLWKGHTATARERAKAAQDRVPAKYPFLHVISDVDQPKNERVRIRGSDDNLGAEVPRRFLTMLSKEAPQPFTLGSGRLELANAVASSDNPLTARVMVNRVWMHHFGKGIVGTPNNFGQMGERPTHPELLDYLATRFMENKWSIKAMHREIMLSATYALSATNVPPNQEVDPENRLLWRANRRRLDVEVLRDSMLHVAGNLDLTAGGPALAFDKLENTRRTVYSEVSRKSLDLTLGLFDFPNPIATSPRRIETSTPLQGLFFLNSDLVMRQAEALVKRVEKEAVTAGEDAKVQRAYQLLFGRSATDTEVHLARDFIQAQGGGWTNYAQVLLSSNEFQYVP